MASKTIQIVSAGVVVDAIVVDATAVVIARGDRVEWDGDGLDAPEGAIFYDVENAAIGWIVEGKTLVPPPAIAEPPPPPAPPIVLSPADFFGRMTDDEAEAIDTAMRVRPIRVRSIWAGVADQGRDLLEDSILWPALRAEIVKLYDEARADALLARPN